MRYGPVHINYNTHGYTTKWVSADRPSQTILTSPEIQNEAGWVEFGWYEENEMPIKINKPPYRVPSMREIESLPWNGYNVVSSFSGTGGSCLGYRLAGYKVLWANEFIPAAQESYKANHPHSILDTRDICKVQPEEILKAIGLKKGEIDIFDGSPPCSAFSTAGKREAGWGDVKKYSDTKQRVDDLFFEYTRLLKGLQPKVFVAENVSGLVKGTAKGYFLEILKALKECGYTVSAKLLDAQWLGVPQMRQRLIFVGVRNDLVEKYGVKPVHPQPLPYNYTVREALPWVLKQGDNGAYGKGAMRDTNLAPSGTIGTGPHQGSGWYAPGIVEAVPVRALRDNRGAFGNGGDITDQPSPTILSDSVGIHWIEEQRVPIRAIHDTAGQFGKGDITDCPCPTITTQQHWYIEEQQEEKTEKRKFTIAELKRICAFPDDFILCGTYSQQWERLGRAVPPIMMSHVAKTIQQQILDKLPKEI